MPEMDLTARVKDYLGRQIAWVEQVLEELDRVDQNLAEEKVESLLNGQSRQEKEMEELAHEYHGLQREWVVAEVCEEERALVRALSERVQERTAALQHRYDEVAVMVEDAIKKGDGEHRALRRGRDMLGKYRPGLDQGPGFIDRKA